MAPARKEVDLIIRAKDEAARAVNAITRAVNELAEAQSGLSQSAEQSDSALGRLGKAVATLDRSLKGLSLDDTLTRDLNRSTAAVDRLEKSLADLTGEAARLDKELRDATAATAALAKQSAEAARQVDKQSAAADKVKTKERELTKALREAAAERDRLVAAQGRLDKQLQAQEVRLAAAKQRFTELSAAIKATAEPTATLQNRFSAAEAAVTRNAEKLAGLRKEYAETTKSIRSTEKTVGTLSTRLTTTTAKVADQQAKLATARNTYVDLGRAAKAAEANQRQLSAAAADNADALNRQRGTLEAAQLEMAQLATASDEARAAFLALAQDARGPLLQAFRQQQTVLQQLRQSQQQAEANLRSLGAEISRVGVPTREMVAAFDASRAAAAAAKVEYAQQQAVLQQMRTSLRSAVTDVDALSKRQQQFAQAQNNSAAALQRVRGLTAAASSAQRLYASAAFSAANAQGQVANQVRNTSGATDRAATSVNRLAEAYRRLYGDSRSAMSITQRLRGEVLSLVTAYAGLYGVINILGQVVNAYQTLEAAQSRLRVITEGDSGQQAQELDFIRRNAERLGIEFGLLANEYTKFAIATKNTNLEGQNTRDIFISVAEAGRVAKLQFSDMQGIFRALTQIVSKGRVQLEELSQQLGDRLPGALQIMADGLGISVQELTDLTKKGEVSSDALVQFGNRLDEIYGAQLQASLETTTTNLGRVQNAAFEALLAFAEQGFLESFNGLLETLLDTMDSADFEAFIGKLSKVTAFLVDVLSVAVDNFDLLVIAAIAFTGVKLIPFVGLLIGGFRDLVYTIRGSLVMMATAQSGLAAFGATAAGATTAVGGLATALRALMSSTGIGLLVTAISVGIGLWATRADEATAALDAHEKAVRIARNAYDEAAGAVDKWAESIKGLTVTQQITTLKTLRAELRKLQQDQGARTGNAAALIPDTELDQITKLREAWEDGAIEVEEYRQALDKLAQSSSNGPTRILIQRLLDTSDAGIELERSIAEAEAVLRVLEGTATQADVELLGLAKSAASTGEALANRAAAGAAKFAEALSELNDLLPEIGQNLDLMKEKANLDAAFASAARAATTMSELQAAVNAANAAWEGISGNAAIDQMAGAADGITAAAALLRGFEGFQPTAKYDVNAFRAGFGSDTVTLDDGSVVAITEGMRVSVEDANRDLIRRIGEFIDVVKGQVGEERFNSFSKEQQAALTSIAYNYGSLPERIVDAVRTGSASEIAAAVRGLANDNGGINRDRRLAEASILGRNSIDIEGQAQAQQEAAEKLREEEEKRLETARKFHEQQAEQIALQQVEIENANKGLLQREIAKALAEAENEAKKAGTVLSEEERQKIIAQVTALNEKKAAEEAINATRERAQAAEQVVNDILAQRAALEERISLARQMGDFDAAAIATQQMVGLNDELKQAIANAIIMWEAVGGTGADAAIAKLQNAQLEANQLATTALTVSINWEDVARTFSSGLTNAILQFATAVGEGTDVFTAARDAFLQFASDFLRKIAEMILQQLIFNAISGLFGGGGGGGGILTGLFGTGHTGGVVGSKRIGSGNPVRRLNPAIFARAPRFHNGGMPGLRPGEVPAVLLEGEEVLSKQDPRNILNGGGRASGGASGKDGLTIVNAFDPVDVVSQALQSRAGQDLVLNVVSGRRKEVKAVLG
jgi:tape measure domain-containing protein